MGYVIMLCKVALLAIVLIPFFEGITHLFISRQCVYISNFVRFISNCLVSGCIGALIYFSYFSNEVFYFSLKFLPFAVYLNTYTVNLYVGLLASVLCIINTLYSNVYMGLLYRHSQDLKFFNASFAFSTCAFMLVVFSGDVFTAFVGCELLTFFTIYLISYGSTINRFNALKYFLFLMFPSIVFFFPAMVWNYYTVGTLYFLPTGSLINYQHAGIIYLLYVLGMAKTAIVPLHRWLVLAMVAPVPVSAFLHAVAVVTAGVFVIFKITWYIFGSQIFFHSVSILGFLQYLALFGIFVSSIFAILQDDIKSRLAYSTISNLNLILLCFFVGSIQSLMGGLLHVMGHACSKIILFFCAGTIYVFTGNKKVTQVNGLGSVYPCVFVIFTIASLFLVGLPFTLTFWSKSWLIESLWYEEMYLGIFVLIIYAVSSIYYLFEIPIRAFLKLDVMSISRTSYDKKMIYILILALLVLIISNISFVFVLDIIKNIIAFLPSDIKNGSYVYGLGVV